MFKCFISYAHVDQVKVLLIKEMLENLLPDNIELWIDDEGISAGESIPNAVMESIAESEVFLLFFSLSTLRSKFIKYIEFALALEKKIKIIPIIIDDKCNYSDLGVFTDKYNLEEILCVNLSGECKFKDIQKLVSAIRGEYIKHVQGELNVIETLDNLIIDIHKHESSHLDLLLIDGGTTVERLVSSAQLKQSKIIHINFLYLDSDFREFISSSPAIMQNKSIFEGVSDNAFEVLYEGLLQASGCVHNRGLHKLDVTNSTARFSALSELGISYEVRKTSQLPLFRMIITEHYLYYTHFMLKNYQYGKMPVQDYYSLRIQKDSNIYGVCKSYFRELFNNAMLVTSSDIET